MEVEWALKTMSMKTKKRKKTVMAVVDEADEAMTLTIY
jgi:hypothetical protein